MPHKKAPTKAKPICPKCHVQLTLETYRNLELDACPSCLGLWLDYDEFDHLTTEKDVYADDTLSTQFFRKPPENAARLYECVRCNNIMTRKNFRNISGILIDLCHEHGVWLDKNELTEIRKFIASGGLDKSQDNELLLHAEDMKSLALRTQNLEFMQQMLFKLNFKRWLFS
jgi:Zn-finger nucleic acid-binding protein